MWRRGVSALLVLLAVGTQSWIFAERGSFNLSRILVEDPDYHSDFATFRASVLALLDGTDIYATDAALPNLNPPLMTVVMTPVALFDDQPGYRLFGLVTVALVLACLLAVALVRAAPPADVRPGPPRVASAP